MSALSSSVLRGMARHADDRHLRKAVLRQAAFLHHLHYFKGSFSIHDDALDDSKAFARLMAGLFKPSRFSKAWKLPVLHSFVLTLLIARGDDRALRRKVGALLQKSEKSIRNLSRLFEKDAAFFGHYVSLIPPKSEAASLRLLRLAA